MKIRTIALLFALALVTTACGQSEEEQAKEAALETEKRLDDQKSQPPKDFEDAVKQFGEAFGKAGDVDTVESKDLQAMLPEKAGGLERASVKSNKQGAFGFKLTTADAVYEGDDGATVNVSIKDIGGLESLATLGLDWADLEMDENTDTGFNRTTEYKGHRAFQSFNEANGRKQASMSVFVGGRFVIDVTGNVDFDVVEDVVDAVPLEQLDKMRKKEES